MGVPPRTTGGGVADVTRAVQFARARVSRVAACASAAAHGQRLVHERRNVRATGGGGRLVHARRHTVGRCVAWPRCYVTPWIGCAPAAERCVLARGPDGPPVAPSGDAPPVETLALVAAGVVLALAALAALVMWIVYRGRRRHDVYN